MSAIVKMYQCNYNLLWLGDKKYYSDVLQMLFYENKIIVKIQKKKPPNTKINNQKPMYYVFILHLTWSLLIISFSIPRCA